MQATKKRTRKDNTIFLNENELEGKRGKGTTSSNVIGKKML